MYIQAPDIYKYTDHGARWEQLSYHIRNLISEFEIIPHVWQTWKEMCIYNIYYVYRLQVTSEVASLTK